MPRCCLTVRRVRFLACSWGEGGVSVGVGVELGRVSVDCGEVEDSGYAG